MESPPTGTVTFLFTDIEGSTRRWQDDPEAMRALLVEHDAILRDVIDKRHGHLFKHTGDGVAAVFASAADAVSAAVDAQARLVEVLPVRMGLHTGEAELRDGDYFGSTLNRCARLMGVAHGGQIVCGEVTAGLVRDRGDLRDLGEHRLRDLSRAERVWQVGVGEFPGLRSLTAASTNLPTVLTELVGRSDEVARLVTLVARERLVTLTGVGGIGKTRLALAVAGEVSPRFADGCWFVELAPAATGDEVVGAVAAALGAPATDRAGLARYVDGRQVLVVLDNCEHVLSDAAALAQALLAAGPDVVIVATSREPLGIDVEVLRGVASLVTPGDDVAVADAAATSAVRLFVSRAQAVSERFALDDSNVAAVVGICRRLDGIPLAIELAAARVRAMSPAEIERRLGERFRLLAASRGQDRHRTLLATVAWSHDLLGEEERAVFRRLAVFPASFDLEAAEAVAALDRDGVDVVDVVLRLVDRSLVQYDDATGRYRMLETLRQYAADRLDDATETTAARDAHAAFFAGLVERFAPCWLDGRYHDAAARLVPELDNLRAAAGWFADTDRWADLQRLAQHASWLVYQFAPADGARWLRQAIDHQSPPEDQQRIDAMGELSYLVFMLGDLDTARGLAERSIHTATERGLAASPLAYMTKAMGWASGIGDPEGLLDAVRAGLAVASARGDVLMAAAVVSYAAWPLAALGRDDLRDLGADDILATAVRTGSPVAIVCAAGAAVAPRLLHPDTPDFAGALDILDRNAPLHRLTDDNMWGLWNELDRGMALAGARHGPATSLLARCLRSADRFENLPGVEMAVRLLVLDAATTGHPDTAAALLGYLDANLTPYRIWADGLAWLDERIAHALDTLTAEDRTMHHARGAAMTRRQLMNLAATLEQTPPQPASALDQLAQNADE